MRSALRSRGKFVQRLLVAVLTLCLGFGSTAVAITPIPLPSPKPNSYGLEATKKQDPPKIGATITTPASGGSYSTSPITVGGTCPTDLLVEIFDNNVLVGSVICKNGSFSLQVSLFTGQNDIYAMVYDDLDQAGPTSNVVSITYNNSDFAAFGVLMTLTSNYARRAANPGSTLTWPLILSGGTGPYAFSIDWGDGKTPDLKSVAMAGNVDVSHVYAQSGAYQVTVRVTDHNGVTAFLQLVAIANGSPVASSSAGGNTKGVSVITRVIWIPAVVCLLLLLPTYWLGKRSELVILRKRLERDMKKYKEV